MLYLITDEFEPQSEREFDAKAAAAQGNFLPPPADALVHAVWQAIKDVAISGVYDEIAID